MRPVTLNRLSKTISIPARIWPKPCALWQCVLAAHRGSRGSSDRASLLSRSTCWTRCGDSRLAGRSGCHPWAPRWLRQRSCWNAPAALSAVSAPSPTLSIYSKSVMACYRSSPGIRRARRLPGKVPVQAAMMARWGFRGSHGCNRCRAHIIRPGHERSAGADDQRDVSRTRRST